MAKTVDEIASELEISVTTVRLVLSGKARQYRIAERTEKRIRDYTDEHGYALNYTARSLKLQRTDTLGLIIPRLSNPFFAELAEKLEIRCRNAGLQLMVSCCHNDPATQTHLIDTFKQRNVDGLFIVPSDKNSLKHCKTRFENRTVILDRDFKAKLPLVMSNNESSGEQLTHKLLTAVKGSPEILFLVGNPQLPTIAARLKGFKQALKNNGIKRSQVTLLESSSNRDEDGKQLMLQWLAEGRDLPDILLTSSLPVFEGALSALRQQLRQIPEQMTLGTFDDHTMLDFLPNRLYAARQNEDDLVQAALTAMSALLNDQPAPEDYIADIEIVERWG